MMKMCRQPLGQQCFNLDSKPLLQALDYLEMLKAGHHRANTKSLSN